MHDGHRERLRERFQKNGLAGFADHETLELLLFYAIPRVNTNDIAHRLIAKFGSLSGVLAAQQKDLATVAGIGENSATLISLCFELMKKYYASSRSDSKMLKSSDAAAYIAPRLKNERQEHFYVLCLDGNYRLVHEELLFTGTINTVNVSPREVALVALRHSAVSVILVHNHPTGSLRPSKSDVQITMDILSALKPLGITLIDHLVIGDAGYYSLLEKQVYKLTLRDGKALYASEDSEYTPEAYAEDE